MLTYRDWPGATGNFSSTYNSRNVGDESSRLSGKGGPNPEITAPTDAIVKITKPTLCGTDLHILKGEPQLVSAAAF